MGRLQYFKVLFSPWNSFLRIPRALFQNVSGSLWGHQRSQKHFTITSKATLQNVQTICTNKQERRKERSCVTRKV